MPYPHPERFDTSAEGLLRLVRQGESASVEFKARLPEDAIVARILTAFANSDGGILLLGVDQSGEVGTLPPWEVGDAVDRLTRISEVVLFAPAYVNATRIGPHWIAYAVVDPAPHHVRPVRTAEGKAFTRVEAKTVLLTEPVGTPQAKPGPPLTIFVAMSFREEEEPGLVDYYAAMERAVGRTGLPIKLSRIDRLRDDFEISQRILDEIKSADAVLADFTLNPHNVYFELGFARGCEKRVVQTARKGTALHFDVRNWRTLFYKNATELEALLVPELTAVYSDLRSGGV